MILWKSSKIELKFDYTIAADIDLFKVNNRNTRTIGEMCLKLTIKTQKDVECLLQGYSETCQTSNI